jgi:hypothetical protein
MDIADFDNNVKTQFKNLADDIKIQQAHLIKLQLADTRNGEGRTSESRKGTNGRQPFGATEDSSNRW